MSYNSLNKIHKKLSIQINLDGFSFCIQSLEDLVIEHYQAINFTTRLNSPDGLLKEVKTIFEKENILHQNFEEVVLIHQNDLQTLVPNDFFEEKHLSDYLKHSVKVFPQDYITFDDIDNIDAKSVYIPFVNINNFIFDYFGSFTFLHANTIFTKTALFNYTGTEHKMFVNVYHNNYHLVVIHQNQVLLSNHFDFNSSEDFIYYLLFVAEQLQMDTNRFELELFGHITETDHNYKLAYQYIRNITIHQNEIESIGSITDINLTHNHL